MTGPRRGRETLGVTSTRILDLRRPAPLNSSTPTAAPILMVGGGRNDDLVFAGRE